MKRYLIKKLCFAVVFSIMLSAYQIPVQAAEMDISNTMYIDVPDTSGYADFVRIACENGIMRGVDNTIFNPDGLLTVAESIEIACKLHCLYSGNSITEIGEPWYLPYVEYALIHGIIQPGIYYYDSPVTRADFALYISNALPDSVLPVINEIGDGSIPDMNMHSASPVTEAKIALANAEIIGPDNGLQIFFISAFMEDDIEKAGHTADSASTQAVYRLYRAGILSAFDEYGTFMPNESITRATATAIVSYVINPALRIHTTFVSKSVTLVPMDQLVNRKSLQKNATNAQLAQAYEEARKIVEPLANLSREAQLCGIMLALRITTEDKVTYSMKAAHYNDPYGFFVLNTASCAGCVRATGLCLNMLGIPYEHVNENQNSHQWCRVEVDGTYWICDAYGIYCGPELEPYEHPKF